MSFTMLPKISRRSFIGAGVAAAAAAGAFSWAYKARSSWDEAVGLVADPQGIIDLPPDFSYQVLQRVGDVMSDGFNAPSAPDGMACFPGEEDTWIIMRNHEIHKGTPVDIRLAAAPDRGGGVSRLVIDRASAALRASNMVLTGTSRNCSGGPTPYGWLSCEEVEEAGHGYVFLCDPGASSVQAPHRLSALGRFPHEAAAFDPTSGITYLSEDASQSAIYRHVPDSPEQPFVGGHLQALKVQGQNRFDLSEGQKIGDQFAVEWVNITDPTAADKRTRTQAHQRGGAIFSRGEGAWFDGSSVYLCSTDGGPKGRGQLYRLDIAKAAQTDTLTLIAQAQGDGDFDHPDNVTVSPWGDIFLAEDGDAPNGVRVLKPDGRLLYFARNVMNDGDSEVTGICFSPDGKWMFLNIQWEDLTLAITGPFMA